MLFIYFTLFFCMVNSQLIGENDTTEQCNFSSKGSQYCLKLCDFNNLTTTKYHYKSKMFIKKVNLNVVDYTNNDSLYNCNINLNSKDLFFNMTYYGNLKINLTKPIIIGYTKYAFLPVNASITLNCKIFSKNIYNLKWVFKDKIIFKQGIIKQNNNLKILNIEKKHSGTYRCEVENVFGYDQVETQVLVF